MLDEFKKDRQGTGTYEWADKNYNIQIGCSNGCLYCYAKARALRFKEIDNHNQWTSETINLKLVNKKWRKHEGVIMFPTSHDITPENLEYCLIALKNILSAGNNVLVVSKPHLSCVQKMCAALEPWKEQIMFRFTIGSLSATKCLFWEPGAPSPEERIAALKYAYLAGYQTSVSMEPMLGGCKEALRVYNSVEPLVTDTIWIGKMNKIRTRVDMSVPQNKDMVENIEELQSDEAILDLAEKLKGEPKVRWKDSIKKLLDH